MKRRLTAAAVLLALLLCVTACADKLDDVTLCVGGSREEWYSSTGGYIGKVTVSDKCIADVQLCGTSLTISNRFYYSSGVSFTALKPGKTTVNFYSEYGGWMGSVNVTVKEHDYEGQPVVLKAVRDNGEWVYRGEKARTCSLCGDSQSEFVWLDGAVHGNCAEIHYAAHKAQSHYSDMDVLRQRLRELDYAPADYAVKGSLYDVDACDAVKLLNAELTGKRTSDASPELIAILLSDFAPRYREGFAGTEYAALGLGDEGENVTALQEKLCALGYLAAENVGGVYDEFTAFAVKLLQINLRYTTIDGNASSLLQGALYLADDGSGLSEEAYSACYERLAACIGEPCADVYVTVTTGCNVRGTASYDGAKLLWADAGIQMLYLDEVNGWYRVQLPDGREGYLPMDRSEIAE